MLTARKSAAEGLAEAHCHQADVHPKGRYEEATGRRSGGDQEAITFHPPEVHPQERLWLDRRSWWRWHRHERHGYHHNGRARQLDESLRAGIAIDQVAISRRLEGDKKATRRRLAGDWWAIRRRSEGNEEVIT